MKIAIIPARGRSKRIKKKNIKIFRNRPIIEWIFEIVKSSTSLVNTLAADLDTYIPYPPDDLFPSNILLAIIKSKSHSYIHMHKVFLVP